MMTGVSQTKTRKNDPHTTSTTRWIVGMIIASIFSLTYVLAPTYIISSLLALVFQYPTQNAAFLYAVPLILSVLIPSTPMPRLLGYLTPMLGYFQFERIYEKTPTLDPTEEILNGKNYILAAQPHGVISFCGMCSAIAVPFELRKIKTAAASVLLKIPILKHVMGVFSLTDATASNLKKVLKNKGPEGCVVIYIGGIAELFKSSRKEERLYLSNRKGFIKMALREGVDIIPVYLFGNTSVLTVLKNGPLARLSRKFQVTLTFFWGQFNLPIPRDEKLLYVSGLPLGMPHIPNPTQEDIDKWHAKYCEEVKRIFDKYKEKVPMYKHKTLFID